MSIYKGYTEKQNIATQKYQKENLEQLRIWVKKGKLAEYKEKAKSKDMSLTAYIVHLIESDKE